MQYILLMVSYLLYFYFVLLGFESDNTTIFFWYAWKNKTRSCFVFIEFVSGLWYNLLSFYFLFYFIFDEQTRNKISITPKTGTKADPRYIENKLE